MIARSRTSHTAWRLFGWTLTALSIGCAQDPAATPAVGMFSLPGPTEFQRTAEIDRQDDLAEANASETKDRLVTTIAENLRRGIAELNAGRPEQAARFYERVLRDDPSNVEALHRLARLADFANDAYAAERHYLAALEQAPNDLDLLSDLGDFYLTQKRYSECEQILQQVMHIDPTHRRTIDALFELRQAAGNSRNAASLAHESTSGSVIRDGAVAVIADPVPIKSISMMPEGRSTGQPSIRRTAGRELNELPFWSPADDR